MNKSDEADPSMSIEILCGADKASSFAREIAHPSVYELNEETGVNSDVSEEDLDSDDQSICDSFYSGKVLVIRRRQISVKLHDKVFSEKRYPL